jgi:hypothetical protein
VCVCVCVCFFHEHDRQTSSPVSLIGTATRPSRERLTVKSASNKLLLKVGVHNQVLATSLNLAQERPRALLVDLRRVGTGLLGADRGGVVVLKPAVICRKEKRETAVSSVCWHLIDVK